MESKAVLTRAILLPTSKSAAYSIHLQENSRLAFKFGCNTYLSPCNAPHTTTSSNAKIPKRRKRYSHSQTALALLQSHDKEKFTFGASASNDVVLRHPRPTDDDCYINLVHTYLYPDPDCDVLVFSNKSTSIFSFCSLSNPQLDDTNLLPGDEAGLDCGSWQITLGKGLVFQLEVIPRPLTETHLSTKHTETIVKLYATIQVPLPVLDSNKPDVGSDNSTLPPKAADSLTENSLDEVIVETCHTLVLKAKRRKSVVAIKMCRGPTAEQTARAWRNEVDIMKDLNNSSVTKLLRYDASKLSLELEYVGKDLAQFIDETRMSQLSRETAYQVWIDVSHGIEYIHAQNILHLDIKPQNILLGKRNRAKICDFGCSIRLGLGSKSHNAGTPNYIPPEYLLDGKREQPADVWAFGITMLFVLGLSPLPGGNWKIAHLRRNDDTQDDKKRKAEREVANKEMREWLTKVDHIVGCIPETLSLLRQMLSKNPRKRPTAIDLTTHLQAIGGNYCNVLVS